MGLVLQNEGSEEVILQYCTIWAVQSAVILLATTLENMSDVLEI